MVETSAAGAASGAVASAKTLPGQPRQVDRQDVFLRLIPPEYWQPQLPSTAIPETLRFDAGNKSLDPSLRELLKYESTDRDNIVPRNFSFMMHETFDWVHELAEAGDVDAAKVSEHLQNCCSMIIELETARRQVILC